MYLEKMKVDGGVMEFVYSTGGREKYYNIIKVGDCVTRAICNATNMDYKEVYDLINNYASREHITKRKKQKSSARNGVSKDTTYRVLTDLGWKWIPTMFIGKGCQVHLNEKELPNGTLIVSVSKHLTCVKNHRLFDTYDCSRNGKRCVYGYYVKEGAN